MTHEALCIVEKFPPATALENAHKQCLLKEHLYVGVVQVHAKRPDALVIRNTAAFLDRVRTEKVRFEYDNEPALMMLAEKVADTQK